MVYHLNQRWKSFIVGTGVIGCLIGLGIFITMLVSGQISENLGALLTLEIIFAGLGAELIYEGVKTKIEVFEDALIYHQSRYTFSAQWRDLKEIVPSPGALVLTFSTSKKLKGGIIYSAMKAVNLHSSLAINYYLTEENRTLIRDRIIDSLKIVDENEIAVLHSLI